MAGSRREVLGTVFSRVKGLLRTGAMKDSDKPIWYDVYASFPPRIEPKFDRYVQEQEPVNILYQEDSLRAKFYGMFTSSEVIDMHQHDITGPNSSICQKFIDKYTELKNSSGSHVDDGQLTVAVVAALQSEGFHLKTHAQVQEERDAVRKLKERRTKEQSSDVSLSDASSTKNRILFQDELFDDSPAVPDDTDIDKRL